MVSFYITLFPGSGDTTLPCLDLLMPCPDLLRSAGWLPIVCSLNKPNHKREKEKNCYHTCSRCVLSCPAHLSFPSCVTFKGGHGHPTLDQSFLEDPSPHSHSLPLLLPTREAHTVGPRHRAVMPSCENKGLTEGQCMGKVEAAIGHLVAHYTGPSFRGIW